MHWQPLLLAAVTVTACASSPGASDTRPSQSVTIETVVYFEVRDDGTLSNVRAEGPSEELKQDCVQRVERAANTVKPNQLGKQVGPNERKYSCYDAY